MKLELITIVIGIYNIYNIYKPTNITWGAPPCRLRENRLRSSTRRPRWTRLLQGPAGRIRSAHRSEVQQPLAAALQRSTWSAGTIMGPWEISWIYMDLYGIYSVYIYIKRDDINRDLNRRNCPSYVFEWWFVMVTVHADFTNNGVFFVYFVWYFGFIGISIAGWCF